ncbi:MAG TPA: GlsB/YeaQ/YmgE family stress response membrane protein [Propionibacteriaceae bacterium]|nr:GlsB/YeaQ/YmgE family stress response membrane protein [Propionibacteriaceae bacterium]
MEVTGIITALVIGLVIGVLGRVVAPGRQNIPLWLTLLVGVAAALVGTAIAAAVGVAATAGIDWLELIIQVALAAVGVSVVAGIYHNRKSRTDKVKDVFKS